MNIGAMSMAMSQSQIKNIASLSVMKLQMNTGKQQSADLMKMMSTMAVDPNKGNALDIKA